MKSEDAPLDLNRNTLDRVLMSRLLDRRILDSKIARNEEDAVPFKYILNCYKRSLNESRGVEKFKEDLSQYLEGRK